MLAHMSLITTTIDLTHLTTFNISCGTGQVAGIAIAAVQVHHRAAITCGIEVFPYLAAKAFDIGGATDIGICTLTTGKGVTTISSTPAVTRLVMHLRILVDMYVRIVFLRFAAVPSV